MSYKRYGNLTLLSSYASCDFALGDCYCRGHLQIMTCNFYMLTAMEKVSLSQQNTTIMSGSQGVISKYNAECMKIFCKHMGQNIVS